MRVQPGGDQEVVKILAVFGGREDARPIQAPRYPLSEVRLELLVGEFVSVRRIDERVRPPEVTLVGHGRVPPAVPSESAAPARTFLLALRTPDALLNRSAATARTAPACHGPRSATSGRNSSTPAVRRRCAAPARPAC